MNVLMLDEKRVMVDANETTIQKMFENLGKHHEYIFGVIIMSHMFSGFKALHLRELSSHCGACTVKVVTV